MTPGDEVPPEEAIGGAAFDGSRILAASALVLLVGGGLLLYLYARGVEKTWATELTRSDLERKASLYNQEARRLLEGSRLQGYVEKGEGRLVAFERLLSKAAPGDEATYLHVRDGEEETLLFKGPDVLQKITVSPHRVEVMEGDGATVRRIVVQEGEEPPRSLDVQQPLVEVLGQELVERAFESPEARLEGRIARRRSQLRWNLLVAGLAGLVLVTLVFATLSWQFGRIRHLEGQVRRQRQLAYLGTLAGGLAHEIRNPLNGIGLNLHLLEETVDGGDERVKVQSARLLGRIKPALDHLETIVEEFLDFARPRPLDLGPVRLDRLLEEVADFLEAQAAGQGAEVRVQVADGAAGLTVEGDKERLRQVLQNLAINALQAQEGQEEALVLLELDRAPRGQAELRVRDRGPGISAERAEKVFQIFFTSRDGGLGLGLPIVRRVVEEHGGQVDLLPSEVGAGACFRIRIPLR
jgi:signal transduction histidine kinase